MGGSLSEEFRVTQSITAGCSCAKAFLMVLCYRAMVRVGAYSPESITLRIFVDASGIQWKGKYQDQVPEQDLTLGVDIPLQGQGQNVCSVRNF